MAPSKLLTYELVLVATIIQLFILIKILCQLESTSGSMESSLKFQNFISQKI